MNKLKYFIVGSMFSLFFIIPDWDARTNLNMAYFDVFQATCFIFSLIAFFALLTFWEK